MTKFKALLAVFAAVFLTAAVASAQTGIPFYTSTEAVGINYGGVWSAMNHTTEGLPVINFGVNKNSEIDAEFHEFVPASASGVSSYLAGVKVTPDLSKLFAKTNLPSDLFTIYGQGAAGESTGDGSNHFSALLGGGIGYRSTPTIGFNILNGYCLFDGSGHCNPVLSSGLVIYFNSAASKALNIRRLVARHNAAKRAAEAIR